MSTTAKLMLLFEELWWAAPILAALLVFVQVQSWLHHPDRQDFNNRWFEQFEANQRARYEDAELTWRVNALSNHWASQKPPQL